MKNLLLYPLISVLALTSACWRKPPPQEEPAPKTVKTYTVQGAKDLGYKYPGLVAADKKAVLAFEVPGLLMEVNVKGGDPVQAGQILARLDPRNFELAVEKAKAQFEKAQADVERNAPLAEKEYVSKAEFDRLKAIRDISKADYDTALKALNDTYLLAPFSGIIANEPLDNFQNVQAKEPVLTLQAIKDLEIIVNIPSSDLIHLDERKDANKTILVEFSDLPGHRFPTKLKSFSTLADPETLTYEVKLLMPKPEQFNILPGMTALVEAKDIVEIDPKAASEFSIPLTAVRADASGQTYVWTVNPEKMEAERRNVTGNQLSLSTILITQGLKSGDVVISAGASNVTENMKVKFMTDK